jgi:uncharacterized protein with gpF-like domain
LLLRNKQNKPLILAPVRANVGIEALYRKKLDAQLEQLHRSLIWWIGAAYRANEPVVMGLLAADAPPDASGFEPRPPQRSQSPAMAMRGVLSRLTRRWQQRFDTLARDLAQWFAQSAADRSDASLKAALRKGGFSVKFQMTRAANDAVQAAIGENIGLIKSIASQHLTQVQGLVMRSIQAGRDLGPLAQELETQFGVTKRRAAFIARDQNNKATAAITRVRQMELGIKEAVWLHSAGGKEPRPSHLAAGKEKIVFNLAEGWFDPHENKHIFPGTLPNCRCVSRPVISGFS